MDPDQEQDLLQSDTHLLKMDLWRYPLRERLPRILVLLTEARADVRLDLQAVFDRAYDEGAFDRSVDYRTEPDPPLSAEDTAWADALLREKSLRN